MRLPHFSSRQLTIGFWLSLLAIMAFGAFLRTYHIQEPLADWHSFRQADTASVTREYVKHGVDLLHPHYQDVSNIQSGFDNPQAWRMVEFPIINGVIAMVLRWQPSWDLVFTSRVFSIGATVISIGALGWLVSRLHSRTLGLLAATVMSVLPYYMYYGRTILPEPFLLCFVLLALCAWWQWLEKRNNSFFWALLATVFYALALLIKPMAVFFLPAFGGMFFQVKSSEQKPIWKLGLLSLIFGLSALPLLWWRHWILQFPTGIPVSDWLYNSNHIRLKPAWWRWLFADRLGRLMFGYWSAGFLVLGMVATFPQESAWLSSLKNKKFIRVAMAEWKVLLAWLQKSGTVLGMAAGMLAYLVVFATGNVQHDYYQVLLVPLVSWLWALGAVWLLQRARTHEEKVAMFIGVVFIAILSWAFAFYETKDWFSIQNWPIMRAGQAVDRDIPADALVIAPYNGDTAFLFQTNRRGWPIGFEIQDKINKGAQYYVTVSYDDEANELKKEYATVEATKEYLILNLQEPLPSTISAKPTAKK